MNVPGLVLDGAVELLAGVGEGLTTKRGSYVILGDGWSRTGSLGRLRDWKKTT